MFRHKPAYNALELASPCKFNRIQMFTLNLRSFVNFVMIFSQTMPLIWIFIQNNWIQWRIQFSFSISPLYFNDICTLPHINRSLFFILRNLYLDILLGDKNQRDRYRDREKEREIEGNLRRQNFRRWKCMFATIVWWITLFNWLHMLCSAPLQCVSHSLTLPSSYHIFHMEFQLK